MRKFFSCLTASLLLTATLFAGDVPRPAPNFAINMPSGKPVTVDQYKGKVRVVAFILTTCPHCQRTIGILSKMQAEYGPEGFQVLASAIEDNSPMNVPGFIDKFHPTFPVGYNDHPQTLGFLQHPPMLRMLMPQVVFIDRRGIIRAQYGGDDTFLSDEVNQEKNLRGEVEKLLKEAVAKPAAALHKKASK